MKTKITFETAKEMVDWLMSNENIALSDSYGRKWKYLRFKFYFKDISSDDFEEKIGCLHLYGTELYF